MIDPDLLHNWLQNLEVEPGDALLQALQGAVLVPFALETCCQHAD